MHKELRDFEKIANRFVNEVRELIEEKGESFENFS